MLETPLSNVLVRDHAARARTAGARIANARMLEPQGLVHAHVAIKSLQPPAVDLQPFAVRNRKPAA